MPTFSIEPRAARESVTFEAHFDGPRRKQLKSEGLTERWFLEFGKPKTGYGVARNVKKASRKEALQEIERRLVNPLVNGDLFDYAFVPRLATDLAERGLTTGRAISLLSKLSFILRPGDYPLYDANARQALKARGHDVRDGNYVAYCRGFDVEYRRNVDALIKACSSDALKQHAEMCGLNMDILTEEWFRRRIFDWQLWLEGGGKGSAEILPPSA